MSRFLLAVALLLTVYVVGRQFAPVITLDDAAVVRSELACPLTTDDDTGGSNWGTTRDEALAGDARWSSADGQGRPVSPFPATLVVAATASQLSSGEPSSRFHGRIIPLLI